MPVRAVAYESAGRFLLSEPPGPPTDSRPLLLGLHGYGQPPDSMVDYARRLAPTAVVVAPEGPSAFRRSGRRGVARNWIADPDRALEDRRNTAFLHRVLEALGDVPHDARQRFLLAYSQGVGVGLHAWMHRPDAFAGAACLAGGLADAYRADLARLAKKPVLWIAGRHDEGYPPAYVKPLLTAWAEAGASLEAVHLDAPHDLLEPAFPVAQRWLQGRLGDARSLLRPPVAER